MDYSKLKGRIVEKFGSQNEFCKALGCTPQSLSQKLNGKNLFSMIDILKIVELLEIPVEEIHLYFFTKKVS